MTSISTRLRPAAICAAAVAASLLLAACGSSDDAAGTGTGDAPDADVTLVLGTTSDDFYKSIECGAKTQAKAAGVNLTVQGAGQFDATLQIPVVNAVAASRPDAIIIAPNDDTALYAPLKAATDTGSKLILVDTTLKQADLAAGHIGSDYVLYGKQGAEQIGKLTGGKGTVLGIFSPPGVSTNDQGRTGFEEGLKAFPGITLLPFQFSSGEAGKSAAIVSAALAAHPDLVGIFTFNGGDAQGVVTALREANAADRVSFVSGDAQPFQVEQLKAGQVKALVIQQARKMGSLSIDYALKAIAGEDVPAETALPTVVGDMSNITTPEVADNLYGSC